jgi:hypothetical protein
LRVPYQQSSYQVVINVAGTQYRGALQEIESTSATPVCATVRYQLRCSAGDTVSPPCG